MNYFNLIKSNGESVYFRREGNNWYAKAEYIRALECYNKSLCSAMKIESKEAAHAFANRSAVYFTMELPDQCLENIKLARDAGYPAEMMEILNEREKKCMVMKQQQPAKVDPGEAARDFFKLSYPSHEKIPFLANCIEMHDDKNNARLYATQDLKPGDVIMIWKPAFQSIHSKAVYTRCTNCLETNWMNLIPCPSCVSTMFCSKKCQEEATEKFHAIECPVQDEIRSSAQDKYGYIHFMMQSFLEAKHAFGGIKKLVAICTDKEIQKKTFMDYDLREEDKQMLVKNQLLSALGRSSIECPILVDVAVNDQLMNSPPIRSLWTSQSEKQDAQVILKKILRIAHYPAVDEGTLNDKAMVSVDEALKKAYAYGIYFSDNYTEYNCRPNVVKVIVNSQKVFIVQHNIKKGELISESPSL